LDYDEAKAEVMRLHPAQVHARRVAQLANSETADAGFVVWAARPPSNSPYALHRETFADAIYTALGFCQTNFKDEWVVLGRIGATVVRSLCKFKETEGVICWPTSLVFIGQLGIIHVYMNAELPSDQFLAGVMHGSPDDSKLCCRGHIQDSPVNFGIPCREVQVGIPYQEAQVGIPYREVQIGGPVEQAAEEQPEGAGALVWRALQGAV
jgi:hypothetical protein